MKPLGKNSRQRSAAAMTLLEVVLVVVLLAFLGLMMISTTATSGQKAKAQRIRCVNNLKQVGLAFKMWAPDSRADFPMEASTNHSGTLEVANEVWRTFQVMSNELSDPRILICPADTKHVAAANFTNGFGNENISYFIGLDAREESPRLILTGDRNLTNSQPLQNHVMTITSNTPVGWTGEMHSHQGNIGLADGSVQQLTDAALRRLMNEALEELSKDGPHFRPPVTNAAIRLALP